MSERFVSQLFQRLEAVFQNLRHNMKANVKKLDHCGEDNSSTPPEGLRQMLSEQEKTDMKQIFCKWKVNRSNAAPQRQAKISNTQDFGVSQQCN